MEIYQLRTFAAVALHQSVTRAAEHLFTSQPAVSAQVKALESTLGVALFSRTSTGMKLTQEGQQLLPRAQAVLAAAQELELQARVLSGSLSATLRVGVNDGSSLALDALVEDLLKCHPELVLHFEVGRSKALYEGLANNELDVAFAEGLPRHAHIAATPLSTVPLCVAIPLVWQSELREPDWHALAAKPWCFTSPESSHHQVLQQLCETHGVQPELQFRVDHEGLALHFVRRGIAATLAPLERTKRAAANGELAIWPHFSHELPLCVAALKERTTEPALAAFLRSCTRVFPSVNGSNPSAAAKRH